MLRRSGALTATKIDRFLREARLASRLDHPYAAHIYAFGAEPDGELWIAMEHVKGGTLDELVNRRGPIPPAIFGALFARICEVVHTAHELGIVHRDLKGGNVMVIERAGQLLPKLLDFGIAKADGVVMDGEGGGADDDGGGGGDMVLTQVGATLGSPHYMSPEQWLRPADVDARADIYALGVLAYRCVSGVVPFKSIDRAALVDAHLHAPPPALPDHVPPGIAAAIARALEKDPGARWATALALGEAVQRAAGSAAPETVPIFDPYTRDVWLRAGPQPIADAVARLAEANTAIDCDAAVRELVAITCRWLAVLALATMRGNPGDAEVRDRARDIVGRDDAQPWLELARAIARSRTRSGDTVPGHVVPGLVAALAGSDALAALAERLDDNARNQASRGGQPLALDIAAAADALRPLEPLLAYQLVVGRGAEWAESWIGTRRRERERVLVWGDALGDGEVALLDAAGKVVARLSPLACVIAPLPSADPELFLLWRGGRGAARMVAAPWGYEVDDDRAGQRLATLTHDDGETEHDARGDASPYPGLAAYREADADPFVGREREVEALANRLIRAPLLAVLGPSGAGKSSFLHAGVVPRLEANGYRVVTMRPGRHPMHALAALPTISADSHDEAATALRLRELGESAVRGLVVVVDQLEELVTLCDDAVERTRFAETLAAAADGARAPVRVIVTLRDDFAAVIESEPALRGRFEVFVLGTPLPEALRRIVVEPARAYGVAVANAVVDDMVAEVAGRPASLPLLSFTAAQLWRTRDLQSRMITREAYLAIGGVAGALSTYADQIYDALARKDQQVVRAVFARLVAGDGTRIPTPRAELEQLPDTKPVLAHLIDARLLVVRDDDVVELVHECLAERWDRLARWRREDVADHALVADLRAAARRWLATGRSADLLWRGQAAVGLRRLLGAAKPAARTSIALTDVEREFATASDAAERRARWVRRGAVATVMTALAAVAIVMATLGIAAKHSRDEAQQSAAEAVTSAAEARASAKVADDRLTTSLIAQGTSLLNEGHEQQALAFFAEVLRRGADSVGLRQMIAVASRGWRDSVAVVPDVMVVTALPGGGFVVGDRAGRLRWIGDDGSVAKQSVDLGLGEVTWLKVQGDHVMAIADRGVAAVGLACCTVVAKLPHSVFVHSGALGPGGDEVATVEKRRRPRLRPRRRTAPRRRDAGQPVRRCVVRAVGAPRAGVEQCDRVERRPRDDGGARGLARPPRRRRRERAPRHVRVPRRGPRDPRRRGRRQRARDDPPVDQRRRPHPHARRRPRRRAHPAGDRGLRPQRQGSPPLRLGSDDAGHGDRRRRRRRVVGEPRRQAAPIPRRRAGRVDAGPRRRHHRRAAHREGDRHARQRPRAPADARDRDAVPSGRPAVRAQRAVAVQQRGGVDLQGWPLHGLSRDARDRRARRPHRRHAEHRVRRRDRDDRRRFGCGVGVRPRRQAARGVAHAARQRRRDRGRAAPDRARARRHRRAVAVDLRGGHVDAADGRAAWPRPRADAVRDLDLVRRRPHRHLRRPVEGDGQHARAAADRRHRPHHAVRADPGPRARGRADVVGRDGADDHEDRGDRAQAARGGLDRTAVQSRRPSTTPAS